MKIGLILLAIVAVIGIWLMAVYNGLVKLRNFMQEGWSGIDVQLKRRFDLIPNLVETVKGYATHEQQTLQNVIKARSEVTIAGNDPEARLKAENTLSWNITLSFRWVAEGYPDLKANQNFLSLQEQLSEIEDALQMARRYYNGTVRNLNTAVQRFPAVLIARRLGFKEAPFFEAEEDSKQAPKVSF